MKLVVTFDVKRIPLSYHFLFVSLIKGALSVNGKELAESMYNFEGKTNKKIKDFSFAIYLNDFTRLKDDFVINGDVKMIFSTSNYKLLLLLQNGLMTLRSFKYKKYGLTVKKIHLGQESLPQDNYALFQTLSPIAIKGRSNNFLRPDEDEYQEAFQYICNEIIKSVAGRDLYKTLQFTPIEMKKVVVKMKHDSFSMNREGIFYVEAYKGLLQLEGAREDLQLLTQTGIGYRRSQGFGVIEHCGQ